MGYQQIFGQSEPKDVLRFFYDISQIPRVPGHMKAIADYMEGWAKERGLDVLRDETDNLLVRKPATKGREDRPAVILQSHMDMVCEKEPGIQHDFYKDPLALRLLEGNKVMATGTTLGADDGLGMAQAMAILDSDSLAHPPIEALFTVDEETDMKGAWNFDCSQLTGNLMINLDSKARLIAGSGELEYKMRFPKGEEPVVKGSQIVTLAIGGLLGGHTGQDAMEERGNAIVMVNRLLINLAREIPFQLLRMQGGRGLSSAYARDASATIAFPPQYEERLRDICQEQLSVFRLELEHRDPGVSLKVSHEEAPYDKAMDGPTFQKLSDLLLLLPDGVFTRNRIYRGAMESTSNVGVVETEADALYLTILIRGFMESRRLYLLEKVQRLCARLDVTAELSYSIPHWERSAGEDLLALVADIYGDDPLTVSQGTLKTGIFGRHMPGAQIIALACPYYSPHSPEEHFFISELQNNQKKLETLLGRL